MAVTAGTVSARRPRAAGRAMLAWAADNRLTVGALAIWGIVLLAALFPQLFAGADPNAQDLSERLLPPLSAGHVLGTDAVGQDVYARLVYGARTSVLVGFGAVIIGGTIGTLAGMVAGYQRRLGAVINALIDIQLAFPGILIVLAVVVMLGHSSIVILAVVFGLTGWAEYARLVRGVVIGIRGREFIVAAQVSGARQLRIMLLHILPNMALMVAVLAGLDLSRVVLAEAAASFLGFGIQPPDVSWGLMLASGREYMYVAWWLVALPGIAIALIVLCANVIVNSLQAEVDPTRRRMWRPV